MRRITITITSDDGPHQAQTSFDYDDWPKEILRSIKNLSQAFDQQVRQSRIDGALAAHGQCQEHEDLEEKRAGT
jgi:hypothetical protein